MTNEELKEYLISEAEYSEEEVNKMSAYRMLDAWLSWNGICGYTDDIIDVTIAAYGKDLE